MFEYLRPEKARISEVFYHNQRNLTGKLHVDKFNECTLYPHYAEIPKDENTLCLPEYGHANAWLITGNSKQAVKVCNGTTIYGGHYYQHWGHFLVNTLARSWYWIESIENIDQIVFIADNKEHTKMVGNFKELIELAGLKDKIIIINEPTLFEKLIVPQLALNHVSYSNEFTSLFKHLIDAATKDSKQKEWPQKVFLTRSKLKNAQLNEINIDLIDRFFLNNGYEILSPERMSLRELIGYLQNAKSIVSICGTLSHNFLFACREADFAIIERHAFINEWQMTIDRSLGITPDYIDAFQMPMQSDGIGSLFLYRDTTQLKKWSIERHLKLPNFPNDSHTLRKELRKYLKRYFNTYGYSPHFNPYDVKLGSVYVEAILEATKVYGGWTSRRKPLFINDYFCIRCHPKLWKLLSKIYHRILSLKPR